MEKKSACRPNNTVTIFDNKLMQDVTTIYMVHINKFQ